MHKRANVLFVAIYRECTQGASQNPVYLVAQMNVLMVFSGLKVGISNSGTFSVLFKFFK